MKLELAGQTCVIIGGAQGIGRAIGVAFAEEGCQVQLLDLHSSVSEVAQEIQEQTSVACRGSQLDATQYEAVQQAASSTRSSFGTYHHLVYAAGAGSGKFGFPFWNLEPSDWARALNVNLVGAVNAAHAFREELTSQRRGTMLFLSSIAAQIGSQTDPPYSAAKAGLLNFAQCAAKDLAPYDVRVNTICPGMVKTAVNRAVWQAWANQSGDATSYEDWAEEKIKKVAPLGRWQTCEDVAALAVFLASPRAANITGQTMNVDGGQVMHW